MKKKILFVCLGNICRSPTAEGVFRTLAERRGLSERLVIDSAGTGSWHTGEPPDPRMREAASEFGFALSGSAREIRDQDFDTFDLVLAMDDDNLKMLRERMGPGPRTAQVKKFRDFDPEAPGADVPDPYYGETQSFVDVVRIAERTAHALLDHLEQDLD